jgi:hypothetical protein
MLVLFVSNLIGSSMYFVLQPWQLLALILGRRTPGDGNASPT